MNDTSPQDIFAACDYIDKQNQNTMTIARKSPFTGNISKMTIPLSEKEFNRCAAAWQNGTLIQDAFPTLDADQREFIKTGITPEEWNEAFLGS